MTCLYIPLALRRADSRSLGEEVVALIPIACRNRKRYALLSAADCDSRLDPEISGVCSLILYIEAENAVEQSMRGAEMVDEMHFEL